MSTPQTHAYSGELELLSTCSARGSQRTRNYSRPLHSLSNLYENNSWLFDERTAPVVVLSFCRSGSSTRQPASDFVRLLKKSVCQLAINNFGLFWLEALEAACKWLPWKWSLKKRASVRSFLNRPAYGRTKSEIVRSSNLELLKSNFFNFGRSYCIRLEERIALLPLTHRQQFLNSWVLTQLKPLWKFQLWTHKL